MIWPVIDLSKVEKPPKNVVGKVKKILEGSSEAPAGNTRSKVKMLEGVKKCRIQQVNCWTKMMVPTSDELEYMDDGGGDDIVPNVYSDSALHTSFEQ